MQTCLLPQSESKLPALGLAVFSVIATQRTNASGEKALSSLSSEQPALQRNMHGDDEDCPRLKPTPSREVSDRSWQKLWNAT